MNKVILSADSACDLDDILRKRYAVHCYPYHILLGDKQYQDGVDITADEIYHAFQEDRILPKTAAINVGEFINYFKQWTDEGYEVIHLALGSALSSTYRNCCIAAKELKNVYPIDSRSLSTGIGMLAIEAAERIAQGMSAAEIQQEINSLRTKNQVSFVLDTLEFLHAGGRCNGIASISANLLKIKPCIEVDNTTGKMRVGQKFRGALDKVLKKYVVNKLLNREDLNLNRIFITHSGISSELINLVRDTILDIADFKEILVTRAGCTIASHCGPNTLGIIFMTK
jgi:DegV family protein with EDD domain